MSLSKAPAAYALVAWVLASLFLGRVLFVDPALIVPGAVDPSVFLQTGLLYLGTGLCLLWSAVVLVLGVRKIERGTLGEAVVTVVLSGLIVVGVTFGIAALVVAAVLLL